MFTFFRKKFTQLNNWAKYLNLKRFSKNPFFYFGLISFVLLGLLFFSSNGLAQPSYSKIGSSIIFFNPFFKDTNNLNNNDLFFGQNNELALETPDLEIIQGNSIRAVSTPTILTTQTLGDIFGGSDESRREVVDYSVQIGDTIQSVANLFNVSVDTIRWANDLSKNATLKVGQNLVILPVSGVVHIVKNGDTISQVAKTYKAKEDDIVSFNSLVNPQDIFIGDHLIVPNGVMPAKPVPSYTTQVALPNSSLIYPLLKFRITQGLHYFNAVDVQPTSGCGSPLYASAAGTVQRAVANGGWNLGMGNHISILHPTLGNIITYYGHLMKVFVKSGDQVYQGQQIGLVGGEPGTAGAGKSTGCHVHWQIQGAKNPLAGVGLGTVIDVNK